MTTHENTLEEQYRRAPLNGLASGAIVGAVWDTVFLISYVNSKKTIDSKDYPPLYHVAYFPCDWVAHGLVGAKSICTR